MIFHKYVIDICGLCGKENCYVIQDEFIAVLYLCASCYKSRYDINAQKINH